MDAPAPDRTPRPPGAWLCVLASGSAGNCSALVLDTAQRRHVYLIDLGLSVRRTKRDLAAVGLSLDDVAGVLITHLDTDHWKEVWTRRLPERIPVFMHRRHAGRGARDGVLFRRTELLTGPVELDGGAVVETMLHAHDTLGVSVFRFEFPCFGRTLGFATDLGRVTPDLVDHLHAVDVLAIESNYCPTMQLESDRPLALKRRIMGGKGHLSNAQCAQAVAAVDPGEHVVLLHLSRQCNRPELALEPHAGREYRITVTSQFVPTDPIALAHPRHRPPARRERRAAVQGTLFE
jgi:phosphoribosyl 1,2-cyclic phosphodiesterase